MDERVREDVCVCHNNEACIHKQHREKKEKKRKKVDGIRRKLLYRDENCWLKTFPWWWAMKFSMRLLRMSRGTKGKVCYDSIPFCVRKVLGIIGHHWRFLLLDLGLISWIFKSIDFLMDISLAIFESTLKISSLKPFRNRDIAVRNFLPNIQYVHM